MTERRDQATPPLDPEVAERMRRGVHPPAPPVDRMETSLQHPAHLLGRECDGDELLAYARAAAPPGWALVDGSLRSERREGRPGAKPWRGLRATYLRRHPSPDDPPWTPDELRAELALCGGDWQAVAAALDSPYRELRRWLDHASLASLTPLWWEERGRLYALGSPGAEDRPGDRRDPRALRLALGETGPLVAVVRLLELYMDAVEEGREVPAGIREYLRRAGWIEDSPQPPPPRRR